MNQQVKGKRDRALPEKGQTKKAEMTQLRSETRRGDKPRSIYQGNMSREYPQALK